MRPALGHKAWSLSDIRRLVDLWCRNLPGSRMGALLGRSEGGDHAEARWLDGEAVVRRVSVRVDYVARLGKAGKLFRPSHHLGPGRPRRDCQAVDSFLEAGLGSTPWRHEGLVQAAVEDILRG